MRKVSVALFFCFLLLFAALWYIPSRNFRHVLPAPLPAKQRVHSPEKTDRITNDFRWPLTNSNSRKKMAKEKLGNSLWPTRSTTSFSRKWKMSRGDEVISETEIPNVFLPSMKNSQLSKMLLESAKNEKWTSTVTPTQKYKVETQKYQVPKQKDQVSPQKPQVSPQKNQVSPQKDQVSPQKDQVSPQKPQVSPQKDQVSPQKDQVSPQKDQVSPQNPQVETQRSQVLTYKPQVQTQVPRVQTPKYKVQSVLIVFWSTWFGKRLDLDESWTTLHCPVECKVTSDLTRAKDANAFIVHARDPRPLPLRNDVPWILYTQENPVYTPELRDADYMSKFKLLKSYRLDSDFPDPTFTVPNFKPPIPFKNKSGFIMAAFSNCERVRMEYMRQLMTFVTVDSYGACHKTARGLIHRYGSEDFREQKTALARKYKFLLVFFNQDCDYFVDDQLLHALNAGAVPVVMGTDKIGQFMPGNLRSAYINVRNFENPKRLAEYLTFLGNNETEYNKYLEWKSEGFGDIDDTVIGKHFHPPYPPYCQVCVAVAKGKLHEEGLKPDLCIERRFADWNITVGGEMKYQ